MAVLTRDGAGIAYDDAGRGDPPFVFIPEWLCDRQSWAAQIENLSAGYRCISIDPRGAGESGAAGPHDLSTLVDDVAALADHLRLPPAIVVGHGLSGLAALLLNQRYPSVVCGLALADPWLTPVADGRIQALASRVRESNDVGELNQFIDSLLGEATSREAQKQIREHVAQLGPAAAAETLESAAALQPELGRLLKDADAKPFMALWASNPMGNPEELRKTTVFLRQEPIPGGSHFFQLEHPAITSALLRAFVDDVERDPRLPRHS